MTEDAERDNRRRASLLTIAIAVSSVGSFLTFLVLVFDLNEVYGAWSVPVFLLANFLPGLLAPTGLRRLRQRGVELPSIFGLQVALAVVTLGFIALYDTRSWSPIAYMVVIASLKAVVEPQLMSAIASGWDADVRAQLFGNLEVIGAVSAAAVPLLGLSARSIWGTEVVLVADAVTYAVAGLLFKRALTQVDDGEREGAEAIAGTDSGVEPSLWPLIRRLAPLRWLALATVVASWVNVTEFGVFEYQELSEAWVGLMLTAWAVGALLAVGALRILREQASNFTSASGVLLCASSSLFVVLPPAGAATALVLGGLSSSFVLATTKAGVQTGLASLGVVDQTLFWARFGRFRAVSTLLSIGCGLVLLRNSLSIREALLVASLPTAGLVCVTFVRLVSREEEIIVDEVKV